MRKSTAALSLALLASLALCAGLWRELRAERARNAVPRAAPVVVSKTLVPAEAPAPATATASPVPVAAAAAPPTAEATTQAGAASATGENWYERQRRMLGDPKYREARRDRRRLELASHHDNAVRVVGLTPKQADGAIDLWIDDDLRRFEHVPPATITPEYIQQRQEDEAAAFRAYQARIDALLGAEKGARWKEYVQSLHTRARVEDLRNQLGGADALRDDQVEPLIAALHAERAQQQQEREEYLQAHQDDSGDPAEIARRYHEHEEKRLEAAVQRMHQAASPILTRAQLEQLDSLLGRDLARLRADRRLNRLQSTLDRPAGAGTN